MTLFTSHQQALLLQECSESVKGVRCNSHSTKHDVLEAIMQVVNAWGLDTSQYPVEPKPPSYKGEVRVGVIRHTQGSHQHEAHRGVQTWALSVYTARHNGKHWVDHRWYKGPLHQHECPRYILEALSKALREAPTAYPKIVTKNVSVLEWAFRLGTLCTPNTPAPDWGALAQYKGHRWISTCGLGMESLDQFYHLGTHCKWGTPYLMLDVNSKGLSLSIKDQPPAQPPVRTTEGEVSNAAIPLKLKTMRALCCVGSPL